MMTRLVTGFVVAVLTASVPPAMWTVEAQRGGPALPPPPINGMMPDAALGAALDPYLQSLAAKGSFAGTVLVSRGGAVIFEKSYGLANRADKVPNTPATRFNIGSLNKEFTKTALAQLVAGGKLALTDTLGRHIPDYPNADARAATLDQLVNHRGGIADFFGEEFDRLNMGTFRSNRDYYAYVAPKPLLFPPGSRRQYCNGCYIVLGEVIARLSGMPYEQYVAENIFRPAAMTQAAFLRADEIHANVAEGYTRRDTGGEWRTNAHRHGAAGSAAGGAYLTAGDLMAFYRAASGGVLLDAKGTSWLFGGDPASVARGTAGGAPGINAAVEWEGSRWTIVVTANQDPPSAVELAAAIARALRG